MHLTMFLSISYLLCVYHVQFAVFAWNGFVAVHMETKTVILGMFGVYVNFKISTV